MSFVYEALACLFWFMYSSFFEWFGHRYVMHVKRFPLQFVYDGHTRLHHLVYRGDSSFVSEDPNHVAAIHLRWFSFPAIILLHLPAMILFQQLTGLPTCIGGIVGAALYYAGFEYTHYLMHVPRGHYVERCRWFRFIRNHHLLHHTYMRKNFNVFVPLADLCLGTLLTTREWRARRTPS